MKFEMFCGTALVALAGLASSSMANTVDLVHNGFGNLGDSARFVRTDFRSAGTGVIQSFVRLQNSPTEQGYNTSGRPLQFDENSSQQYTRNLQFGQVPTVIGTGANGLNAGVAYKEFLLDINQQNSNPLLSLNRVRIYTNAAGGLNTLGNFTSLGPLVYDMGTTNDVQMDYSLNSGSGQGDMAMYIPVSNFVGATAGTFVYLYSQFGLTTGFECNDGFEEWSVQSSEQLIPLPASVWMGGAGLLGLAGMRLRRRR